MSKPDPQTFSGHATCYATRNYAAHVVEGGLYMGAMAMISGDTVMPTIVKELGGPSWLISLMPVLAFIGFTTSPILTAHWIDRARRFRPYCLASGIFQRLPYLGAALALLYLGGSRRVLLLALVAGAPLVSGIVGGLTMTAWQQLLIKTVRVRRRSSMLAMRNIIACLLGAGGGWVVKMVLVRWPGTTGYGLLHLMAFGFTGLSYLVFLFIREAEHEPHAPERSMSMASSLRLIPELLRGERPVRLFLIAQMLGSGLYILVPFLAIQAQTATGKGESYVGDLLFMQMVGAVVGNLLVAFAGDRWGPRLPMIMGRVIFVAIAVWAAVATGDVAFRVIFLLYGFAFFMQRVGQMTMGLEIVPTRRRAAILAVMSLVNMPSMLIAVGVCAVVRSTSGSFTLTAVLAASAISLSLVALLRMPNPRKIQHP